MPGSSRSSTCSARDQAFIDPVTEFGLAPEAVIAGVDEVGRGALAGPVTAAAVVLRSGTAIEGLRDSKQLTPKAREAVAAAIRAQARAVAIAHVEPRKIDSLGIAEATRRAMIEALAQLPVEPDLVLVDGSPVDLRTACRSVVKGDSLVAEIAAASVVAKVERDRIMLEIDAHYPGYGFAAHKGYGTAEHIGAIQKLGPCAVHRRSFAPCSQVPLF